MATGRWDRLRADLETAGIEGLTVTAKPYSGSTHGRTRHGTSRSITFRRGDRLVVIGDKWWSKNPEVWIGWQVTAENADDIVCAQSPLSKNRSEVVAWVVRYVASLPNPTTEEVESKVVTATPVESLRAWLETHQNLADTDAYARVEERLRHA